MCGGGNGGDPEEKKRNDEIDKQIRADRTRLRSEVKLLLLGAGESGKSTILKQMKLIHDVGYTREDKEAFKEIIFSNTIQSMKVICEAMEVLGIAYELPESGKHADLIASLPSQLEAEEFPADAAAAIKALLADPGVQSCFGRSSEYQLNDSAKYYFDSIDRLSAKDYLPTDQDVLRSRVKTTGITETKFMVGDLVYRMFDVGGQRSERKKWIHCFDSVTAIIFVVAISAYDQVLIEDETVNRMQEALTLFDSICNSKWFVRTSIILFLNKIDIFKEKIPKTPLNKFFSDYNGGADADKAADFFTKKFISLNQSDVKQVYTHLTCATDTAQIKFVMNAVNDIIIQNNLRDLGLL